MVHTYPVLVHSRAEYVLASIVGGMTALLSSGIGLEEKQTGVS